MYHYYVRYLCLVEEGNQVRATEGATEVLTNKEITHFLALEIIKDKIAERLKENYNYSHCRVFINSYQLLRKASN